MIVKKKVERLGDTQASLWSSAGGPQDSWSKHQCQGHQNLSPTSSKGGIARASGLSHAQSCFYRLTRHHLRTVLGSRRSGLIPACSSNHTPYTLMKLILASLVLLMTLSSCCSTRYVSRAPEGRRGGYVPTPPPKFSGAGTLQAAKGEYVEYNNATTMPYYNY